ncbi:hypothetical protein [Sorangium sp. So ce204]|uniref:hypothetical protein n=1 Tax=Sorangium sp. So ce204 TaxID=3133288 RepID=UPI003F628412
MLCHARDAGNEYLELDLGAVFTATTEEVEAHVGRLGARRLRGIPGAGADRRGRSHRGPRAHELGAAVVPLGELGAVAEVEAHVGQLGAVDIHMAELGRFTSGRWFSYVCSSELTRR